MIWGCTVWCTLWGCNSVPLHGKSSNIHRKRSVCHRKRENIVKRDRPEFMRMFCHFWRCWGCKKKQKETPTYWSCVPLAQGQSARENGDQGEIFRQREKEKEEKEGRKGKEKWYVQMTTKVVFSRDQLLTLSNLMVFNNQACNLDSSMPAHFILAELKGENP